MYFQYIMSNTYPQSSQAQARAQFYRELPSLLAPAFPGVNPAQLQVLTSSALRYFRFSLYADDLLDGDIVLTPANGAGFLEALSWHEQSIKGLAWLFPATHPFWQHFEGCRQAFDQAQHSLQTLHPLGKWTQESFELLAVAKSAMSEVICFALHGLSNSDSVADKSLAAVLDCLRWYHVASQYEDDITDFCDDWQKAHYTYTHAQVLSYVQGAGVSQEPPISPTKLQQYLFTSGIANQLLSRAEHYYRRVTTQAQFLGLTTLATLAIQQATGTAELRQHILAQVNEATSRAQAQLQAQSQSVDPASVAA